MSFDAFIAGLSPEDKRKLSDQLAFELRGGTAAISDSTYELWDALCEIAGQKPIRAHLQRFITDFGRAKFDAASELLEALLAAAIPHGTRRPIVMAVRRVVLTCLANNLRSRDLPSTQRTMLSNFSMLRYAVDQEFPGYIDAKLLHRVAQAVAVK